MSDAGHLPQRRWLRFTLKSLMLLVLLVCCTLGGFSLGRDAGRREAQPEIDQLNAECADLMQQAYLRAFFSSGSAWSAPGLPGATPPPPTRFYDFTKPEDRAEFRKHFAHPSGRGGAWWGGRPAGLVLPMSRD